MTKVKIFKGCNLLQTIEFENREVVSSFVRESNRLFRAQYAKELIKYEETLKNRLFDIDRYDGDPLTEMPRMKTAVVVEQSKQTTLF